ncbi:hypothetical protein T01_9573 [Trichinella spiralis]|uniref:FLYWCH-type domain-containing protein n=1 Tax=Trichinella spiralis TaxID=6334 RepID=A0A0V1B5E8_TRISP|nr:hypothetical protein T01_9573 [Trichinella spiralis]
MAENLHLVLNERGNCNLVHEGRVYNLKHTNMQDKQWVCRQGTRLTVIVFHRNQRLPIPAYETI